jgi:hypothetical protein
VNTKSYVTLPGQEPVWNMAPGRTAALKLLNEQTGQSVMAFEEVTPVGTETPLHLHHDSDEVMYILSGQYSFKIGDDFSAGGPGTCAFHVASRTPGRTAEPKRVVRSSYTHRARPGKCSRSQYDCSAPLRLRRLLILRLRSSSTVMAGRSLGLRRSKSNT